MNDLLCSNEKMLKKELNNIIAIVITGCRLLRTTVNGSVKGGVRLQAVSRNEPLPVSIFMVCKGSGKTCYAAGLFFEITPKLFMKFIL